MSEPKKSFCSLEFQSDWCLVYAILTF